MREVEAALAFEGADWRPVRVHHVALGLDWTVTEVLEDWRIPGWPAGTSGKPGAVWRFRLRVTGPLPGRPAENGQFVLVATMYGTRAHWWIKPAEPGVRNGV